MHLSNMCMVHDDAKPKYGEESSMDLEFESSKLGEVLFVKIGMGKAAMQS